MPKTRKFIDKKKSISFQLVHRSQQDPLIADDEAPQRVLLPLMQPGSTRSREKIIEEQQKYGIYFNDDSDYLQHLKDINNHEVEWPANIDGALEERKLRLPSTVFASQHEEKEGMLSKAAPVSGPQLHLDPDLVAAMDEDFDYSNEQNQLEDDFIELADGVASDQEFDAEYGSDFGSENRDEVNSLAGSQYSFDNEETKSRFTNYSMSSSVIRRNEQLTLLDGRFEKMFAEYDDNQIGALECEEIEGYVPATADTLQKYAEEFEQQQETQQLNEVDLALKVKTLELSKDQKEEFEYFVDKKKPKFDCETILSTYSNIYNLPKSIPAPPAKKKIRINSKTGIPSRVLGDNHLNQEALDWLEENSKFENGGPNSVDQSVISKRSMLTMLSIRPKDETPEERKERKSMLKAYKKGRRVQKKSNKEAFKEERKRQIKEYVNNKHNVRGKQLL